MQAPRRIATVSAWLTSVWTWLFLFVPTFLVVVLQEEALGWRTTWGLAAASTLIQQLAAGIITLAVALWARRRYEPALAALPAILLCVALGVARGVAGGLVTAWLVAGDPQFLARIISWVVISIVWMILVSALLSIAQVRWEARSAGRPAREELGANVRDALTPAINDALATLSGKPSDAELAALADRLGEASERASTILTAIDRTADSAGRGAVEPRQLPVGALIAGIGVVVVAALGVALVTSVPTVEAFLANGWGIRTAMYFALAVGLATAALLLPTRRGVNEIDADAAARDAGKQLESQLHGPVLGRVSAAAMALSFRAHEQGPAPDRADRADDVLATVRGHLAAASADLAALTAHTAPTRNRRAHHA